MAQVGASTADVHLVSLRRKCVRVGIAASSLGWLLLSVPGSADFQLLTPPPAARDSVRIIAGFIIGDRGSAPFSSSFMADSSRVTRLAREIARESTRQEFGLTWPYGRTGDAPCAEYAGAVDNRDDEDYWLFRCKRSDEHGQFDWFYYDLLPDSLPTLERWRCTMQGPASSDTTAWHRAFDALVSELSKEWGAIPTISRPYDGPMAVFPPDHVHLSVSLDLELEGDRAARLTVDQQSGRLDARRRAGLRPSDPGWLERALAEDDSILGAARRRDADALEPDEPELARALRRATPDPRDTLALFHALRRAKLSENAERDRLLYGSDRWIRWLFYDGEDSLLAARIGMAVRPFGVQIQGQDRVWEYDGGLLKPLAVEPWKNEWRERVLVEWMEKLCEYPEGAAWRDVLARGSEFLAGAPRSHRISDVLLHMAEAHETAWSVAFTIDPHASDYAEYRANAGGHREKAIALYLQYLELRPTAADRNDIHFRVQRLRRNIDTGFQKYYCYSDC